MRLTDCINITGVGLEPLRGSAVIESIDLSLVGDHKNPDLAPMPKLLSNEVVPILESIIEREECALTLLDWNKWCNDGVTQGQGQPCVLGELMGRFEAMLLSNGLGCCKECDRNLPIDDIFSMVFGNSPHRYTCYGCLNKYCPQNQHIQCCRKCARWYCKECSELQWCENCQGSYCVDQCMAFTGCATSDCAKFCVDCVSDMNCMNECKS